VSFSGQASNVNEDFVTWGRDKLASLDRGRLPNWQDKQGTFFLLLEVLDALAFPSE